MTRSYETNLYIKDKEEEFSCNDKKEYNLDHMAFTINAITELMNNGNHGDYVLIRVNDKNKR